MGPLQNRTQARLQYLQLIVLSSSMVELAFPKRLAVGSIPTEETMLRDATGVAAGLSRQ